MNTKLIMTSTALLYATISIGLIFAPDEIMRLFGINDSVGLSLIVQLLGAAYFGFAMLNWMAKGAIIGGIYNRPIAIANLSHFLVGGLALIKVAFGNHHMFLVLPIIACIYIIAAGVFGILMSRHPLKESS
jgi:hypothetical protein